MTKDKTIPAEIGLSSGEFLQDRCSKDCISQLAHLSDSTLITSTA